MGCCYPKKDNQRDKRGSMTRPLWNLVFGGEERGLLPTWTVSAVGLFIGSFGAYAVGVFTISGGIVFIPGDAAVLGALVAGLVGYASSGLLAAWLVTFASILGYRADHAFLGLSSRPVDARLAYFLQAEGLAVVAVQAVIIGSIAFSIGALARVGVAALYRRWSPTNVDSER